MTAKRDDCYRCSKKLKEAEFLTCKHCQENPTSEIIAHVNRIFGFYPPKKRASGKSSKSS